MHSISASSSRTRHWVLAGLFAALTAVGAFIRIPIPYVPFTLQFFFCALSGILLGSRWGFASQVIYVLMGLSGLPVFTAGGGPSYVFQPTFGYLVGFCLGGYLTGLIWERAKARNFLWAYLAALGGLAVIYLVGVPYLWMIVDMYLGKGRGVAWAVKVGFLTPIGGDLVLCALIAMVALRLDKLGVRLVRG
ncbi:biotin transporter BioY [Thermanaerovibrio acidaminovorans]|uniref:Biotin transporter n=1 Tax=Thermanaerovibrio acidaminovorans (strain ATCC 49978 / DSM 6589 / Su883) TaxID=525903 RepID=D1B878_THEAS|nr:biotin transporter BioY [Thermanaerovibrio acidaminovorans]ACZ18481.1 BioY protein [Thermanaerovibrio acidaminovorans DSM 6589]